MITPNFIYSIGKKHCEELMRSFYEDFGLLFTSLRRFFIVFGPAPQDAARTHPALIPCLIECFCRGDILLLHSDGKQSRDYVYIIGDVLKVFDLLLACKEGALNTEINVCSGRAVSVRDIVACVQRVIGVEIEPVCTGTRSSSGRSRPVSGQVCAPFPRGACA
jgi:nucleoside-diphosphate-sugar epimerase